MSMRNIGYNTGRSALRTSTAALSSRSSTPSSRRNLHGLPQTPTNVAQGAMPFISKGTVDLLWEGWQKGLLERLNAEVKRSDLENASLVDTVVATSQKPDRIMAFNYASLALNNAFFLSNLTSPQNASQDLSDTSYLDTPPPSVPSSLATRIEQQWGSVTSFKSAFSAAALGMSSNGYLWLVVDDATSKLAIVPTFGAGTIIVQSRIQKGPRGIERLASVEQRDSAGEAESEAGSASSAAYSPTVPETPSIAHEISSFTRRTEEMGQRLSPLLCLSVYEHAWLPDWGIWGRETYLSRFWECVNWEAVAQRYTHLVQQQHRSDWGMPPAGQSNFSSVFSSPTPTPAAAQSSQASTPQSANPAGEGSSKPDDAAPSEQFRRRRY
ncbi:unnamed protein product [Parajaminaea phylloscopi]